MKLKQIHEAWVVNIVITCRIDNVAENNPVLNVRNILRWKKNQYTVIERFKGFV